jgi:predicted RNA-binding protein with RPS1 domain
VIDEATHNPETEHAALPPEALPQADGEPPAGEAPATEAQATEAPATDAPAAEAPAAEAPAAAARAETEAKKPAPRKPRDPAVIRAFRAGQPVQGTVEKVIKGGYEVKVGRCRGFCPQSQMDVHRSEHADEHVGKTYAFKILQLRRGGEDVVISRRALLEAEHEEEMKAVRATLIEGAVMTGRVARLAEFGAFVDLGGIDGLVHVSALANKFVKNPHDVVKPGQIVRVKVVEVDVKRQRIALTMRFDDAPRASPRPAAPAPRAAPAARDRRPPAAPKIAAKPEPQVPNAMALAFAKLKK